MDDIDIEAFIRDNKNSLWKDQLRLKIRNSDRENVLESPVPEVGNQIEYIKQDVTSGVIGKPESEPRMATMVRYGEYSPLNPDHLSPGRFLLGLGEYEEKRRLLMNKKKQEYREYLYQARNRDMKTIPSRITCDATPNNLFQEARTRMDDSRCTIGNARYTLGGSRSTMGDARPMIGDSRSTIGDARYTIGDASTMVGNARYTIGDSRSTMGDASTMIGDVRPMIGDSRSTIGDARYTIGDSRSTMGDASPMIGDARPMRGDCRSTMGDGSSTIGDAMPTISDARSTIGDASTMTGGGSKGDKIYDNCNTSVTLVNAATNTTPQHQSRTNAITSYLSPRDRKLADLQESFSVPRPVSRQSLPLKDHRETYKDELRRQIEEKRKIDAELKEMERREQEKEERRMEQQREKMRQEYLNEEAKKIEKQKRFNQIEEFRRRQEQSKREAEQMNKQTNKVVEEAKIPMRDQLEDSLPIPVFRASSPVIPTLRRSGPLSAMQMLEDRWKVPAVEKNNFSRSPVGANTNGSVLTQLGAIRRQLQLEQMKLEEKLLKKKEQTPK